MVVGRGFEMDAVWGAEVQSRGGFDETDSWRLIIDEPVAMI